MVIIFLSRSSKMGHLFAKPRRTPKASNDSPDVPSTTKPLDVHRPQKTPTQSTKKPSYEGLNPWEKDMLLFHNKARTENGLPPLVWDKALQVKANDWVKFMVQKDQKGRCTDPATGQNRHPGDGLRATPKEREIFLPHNWGQNIYQSNSVQIPSSGPSIPTDSSSAADSVQQWYSECKDYQNKMDSRGIPVGWNNPSKPLGHFTQVMWKGANKVGCARYPCKGEIRDPRTNQIHESKGQVYVCDYDKGNVAGQFPQNVPWPVRCEGKNTWIGT